MKKKFLAAVLSLSMLLAFSGCGKKEGDNIKAGFNAIDQSNYMEAMTCFQNGIAEGENLELAYRGIGIAYMGMAEYGQAVNAFEQALSNGGMFANDLERDINFYLATAQYKNGQLAEAANTFDTIIKSDVKNEDAYFLRGSIAVEQGDYEGGIAFFDQAIECSSDVKQLKIDIYEELAAYGYGEKGSEYLVGVLGSDNSLSEYDQGVLFFYLKDYDNARTHLEKAKLTETKNIDQITAMLGKNYEMLGDYSYASVLYSEYLAQHTQDAGIYNHLGLCKLKLDNPSEAINAFESGLSMNDTSMNQTLKYNLICAYEHAGNFEEAKTLMNEYLVSYPDDEDAKREAIFLSSR